MLYDEKSVLKSKTILGGIVAVASGAVPVLEALGVVPAGVADQIATGLIAVAGGLLAIWGRLTAITKIKL